MIKYDDFPSWWRYCDILQKLQARIGTGSTREQLFEEIAWFLTPLAEPKPKEGLRNCLRS